MVINLKKCVGCNACTVACKVANGLGPGLFYSYVKIGETGVYPHARRTLETSLCNQCANPPCHRVCPVGATQIRPDGVVTVDGAKCIGCRYCMLACPYNVRVVIPTASTGYYDEGLTPYEKARYPEHRRGTVEKCDFCAERLDEGRLPACAQTCPAKSRVFGDLDDPDSEAARLLLQHDYFVLQPDAGTEPNVYYIN
jgi:molybdopterin-containing oxidoreductase family iron-sulfur binding subunit